MSNDDTFINPGYVSLPIQELERIILIRRFTFTRDSVLRMDIGRWKLEVGSWSLDYGQLEVMGDGMDGGIPARGSLHQEGVVAS